jgi:hypothetical protein
MTTPPQFRRNSPHRGTYGMQGSDPHGFDGLDGFDGSRIKWIRWIGMNTVIRPPLASLGQSEALVPMPEVAVAPNASPLDFLSAVYRDPSQPMQRRMRAAIEALPFVHPKLAVTATIGGGDLAAKLEAAMKRSGKTFVLDGKVIDVDVSEACRSSCD